MIISVGNGQFTWMRGMGVGVPRALGGIHVCVQDVRFTITLGRIFSVGNLGEEGFHGFRTYFGDLSASSASLERWNRPAP